MSRMSRLVYLAAVSLRLQLHTNHPFRCPNVQPATGGNHGREDSAGKPFSVGSNVPDHFARSIRFHARDLLESGQMTVIHTHRSRQETDYLITEHYANQSPKPTDLLFAGGDRYYELIATSRHWGLSGADWHLYKRKELLTRPSPG